MTPTYDPQADPVVQALLAEAVADPEVIGLVLLGSRAIGAVVSESDYDAVFVVTDAALARYEREHYPVRGTLVTPPIDTADIWHMAPSTLQLDHVVAWMLPAWAEAQVLYDRSGETGRLVEGLRWMPQAHAHRETAAWYDTYLNSLYRSLKAWRRSNPLGARLEAADTVDALLHTLFALERRWRPYSSRLVFHLPALAGQGWQPEELSAVLLDLLTTGAPQHQQALAQRVVALLAARGFGDVYEGWHGRIDQALAWMFPGPREGGVR
jgi:hypothetical protein